jgi:hypothetical protein
MAPPPRRQNLSALAAFALLACLQAWPLPVQLTTRLTGPPSGDTGVYVWNTWVFGRELIERGGSPYFTSRIFSLDPQADLSLHNYTPFADLLALPFQPMLGVVGAFNFVYLINVTLAGFGLFLLVRRLTGRDDAAFLSGVVFALSPFLVARSAAHFSLISAAPLPFFVYWLDRAWSTGRVREALATGATLAWAAASDLYYAVYCVMLGALLIASRCLAVTPVAAGRPRHRLARLLLDIGIAAIAMVVGGIYVLGGGSIHLASVSISMRSLYTPVLLLTILILARMLIAVRLRVQWMPAPITATHVRVLAIAAILATILLSPTLYAVGRRVVEGRMVSAPVLWRSSAPGVDLAAVVAPNPTHPLTPDSLTGWLTGLGGGFVENVVSIPLVALVTIGWAWRRREFRPPRLWLAIAGGFTLLALGPFVHIAGFNTYIPTPWALLRYVPIIGAARMPSRFAIVAMLGVAVLFGLAVAAILDRRPARRHRILATLGVLLAFELWPVPRTLYAATMPSIYRIVAADPRPVRVLELPFGIRDGLSSIGDYSAASQFYQTFHGKALVGGYLSRVSEQRKRLYLRQPVRRALITLSERRPLGATAADQARRQAAAFIAQANLGYIVVDVARTTPELRAFAVAIFDLIKVDEGGGYELYVPKAPG